MKIAALCTRYQKFQIILNGINLIDELFYRPMIRLLFSNYRDEKWKQYMVEYHPENGLLFCLSEILYNFTKNVEHKEKLLELLKLNNNDFSLRFLYQCILENNIKSIFYTITSISYLLMDSNYELPSYSDKFSFIII